jgi:hypothetical protein
MTHDDSYSDYARQEQARMKLAAELRVATKAKLFDVLQSAGIACVTAAFDGQGDSGQIEETIAFNADRKPVELPASRLTIQTAKADGSGGEESTLPLNEVIERLCYELLEEKYQGWEDGEGAFGEFAFSIADRTLTLTFNERFSDFDTSTRTF